MFASALKVGSLLKHYIKKSLHSIVIPSGNGGQSSWTILYIAAHYSKSKYGGLPVSNSMTVQPSDQISHEVLKCPLISIASGAIQYGVPTNFSS